MVFFVEHSLGELDNRMKMQKCVQNAMILQGGRSIETAKTFYGRFDGFFEDGCGGQQNSQMSLFEKASHMWHDDLGVGQKTISDSGKKPSLFLNVPNLMNSSDSCALCPDKEKQGSSKIYFKRQFSVPTDEDSALFNSFLGRV